MVVTHLVDGSIAAAFILTLTITMEVTMALFHLIHLHGLAHHSLKPKSAQLIANDIS